MRLIILFLTIVMATMVSAAPNSQDDDSSADTLRLLIVTGANNHNWKATTEVLKKIFAAHEGFEVTVELHPERLTAEDLTQYDVLLSNWNTFGKGNTAKPWPQTFKDAYVDFVRQGGGHVVMHAGSTAHYDWPDYQAIGLSNWDITGKTGHGPIHEFEARTVDAKHPILAGITTFKTTDELWHNPRVEDSAHVILEAYSNITKKWEPSVFTGQFGEGRCFTILLGHDTTGMANAFFQQILVRGTQWTAGSSCEHVASVSRPVIDVSAVSTHSATPTVQVARAGVPSQICSCSH